MYDTLVETMDKADNDTTIESECGCVKPCRFMNPVLAQEFSMRQQSLLKEDTTKGKEKRLGE